MYHIQEIEGSLSDVGYSEKRQEDFLKIIDKIKTCGYCETVYVVEPRKICDLCYSNHTIKNHLIENENVSREVEHARIQKEKRVVYLNTVFGSAFTAYAFDEEISTPHFDVTLYTITETYENGQLVSTEQNNIEHLNIEEEPRAPGTYNSRQDISPTSHTIITEEVKHNYVYFFNKPSSSYAKIIGESFIGGDFSENDVKMETIYNFIKITPEYNLRVQNINLFSFFNKLEKEITKYLNYCSNLNLDYKTGESLNSYFRIL